MGGFRGSSTGKTPAALPPPPPPEEEGGGELRRDERRRRRGAQGRGSLILAGGDLGQLSIGRKTLTGQ